MDVINMDHDFWLQRWRDNQIGFHQPAVNAGLKRFWPRLAIAPGAGVFVPLCGKSRDLLWLAQQYRVMGLELSQKAVADFFTETRQQPREHEDGPFTVYSSGKVSLYCGDYFQLQPGTLEGVAAVYDRAGLIALPKAMRQRYVELLTRLLDPGVSMLLLSMDYQQAQMDGPPFAVASAEVKALFAAHWRIELLQRADILDQEPKFRARGLTYLKEKIYRLVRR